MNKIEKAIWDLIEKEVLQMGYELYDVEYLKEDGEWYLRIYIDNDLGIGLDDCQRVSQQVEPIIDSEDPIPGAYYLEISSTGIDRLIKTDAHLKKSIGETVEVKLKTPSDKNVKKHIGKIKAFDENTITFQLEKDEDIVINRENIKQIRIYIKF